MGEASAVASRFERKPALDGLRAFAVLAVVMFHTSKSSALRGGFLGVDVFFVLSGFLITSLLVLERERSGHIKFFSFWARRARRLLPALLLLLAGIAVYARFFAPATARAEIRDQAIATLFYFQNWHIAFNPTQVLTGMSHTWSLSIEEQFYLVWPLVVAAVLWLARRRLGVLFAVALGGAFASAVISTLLTPTPSHFNRAYMGLDTRAEQLLIGAALGVLMLWRPHWFERLPGALLDVLACLALGALATLFVTADISDPWLYHGGLLVVALVVAVVITAAVSRNSRVVRPAMSIPPLVGLGLISYGVYLYHVPIFVILTHERVGIAGIPLMLLRFAVVALVAVASFVLVEMPVRRGVLSPRVRRAGAVCAVTATVVALLLATSGNVTRKPRETLVSAAVQRNLRTISAAAPPGSTRVLVVGDTLAFALGLASGGSFDGEGVRAVSYGTLGCGITDGRTVVGPYQLPRPKDCAGWEHRYRQLTQSYAPRVAVLMVGTDERFDRVVDDGRLTTGSAALERYLDEKLDAARLALTSEGAQLLVTTAPCAQLGAEAVPGLNKILRDRGRLDWFNDVLRRYAARHADVTVAELGAYLCPGGRPVRATPIAFTAAGANAVWRFIAPAARKASLERKPEATSANPAAGR